METVDVKYFTPEISDLRVGYECEIQTNYGYEAFNKGEEIWNPVTIKYKIEENNVYTHELTDIIHMFEDGVQPVRVAYLTKEQIEAEGWDYFPSLLFEGQDGEDAFFEGFHRQINKDLWYTVIYESDSNNLWIQKRYYRNEVSQVWEDLYKGKCKSINEFRTIIKLLEI